MLSTNLKRAALALFLAAASGLPAVAQIEDQIELEIQADVQLPPQGTVSPKTAVPTTQPQPLQAVRPEMIRWNVNVPSPYWIGVEAQPIDDATRTALDLPEQGGIMIARVTEESPAAKAGLKAGDILLQWGDAEKKFQPIESVEHLVKLVQDAAAKQPESPVTLEYRRRGKTETVELNPVKRPEAGANFIFKSENIGPNEHARHQLSAMQQQLKMLEDKRDATKKELDVIKKSPIGKANKDVANQTKAEVQLKLLEAQIQQAEAQLKQFEVWTKAMSAHGFAIAPPGGPNFDVLIPAPGMVTKAVGPINATAQAHAHAQLKPIEWPENLSVTMTRTGNKPAEFVIMRGDDKWEVTAENLKDLPQDIRAIIEPLAEQQKSRMLRLWSSHGDDVPGRVELRVPEGERVPVPGLPIAPPRVVIHATPQVQPLPAAAPPATQKQIDDLHRAVEQLRKQIELMERK